MMKSDKSSSFKQAENWIGLENLLSKNLQPVSPRSVFVDHLRSRLENPDSVTLDPIGKTSRFVLILIGIVTGLVLIVFTVRIFVYVYSRARTRRRY